MRNGAVDEGGIIIKLNQCEVTDFSGGKTPNCQPGCNLRWIMP